MWTNLVPAATRTRLGAGRNWDRATRHAYSTAFTSDRRAAFHHLFHNVATETDAFREIDAVVDEILAQRPFSYVCGAMNNYLLFKQSWRRRLPTQT